MNAEEKKMRTMLNTRYSTRDTIHNRRLDEPMDAGKISDLADGAELMLEMAETSLSKMTSPKSIEKQEQKVYDLRAVAEELREMSDNIGYEYPGRARELLETYPQLRDSL